MTADEAASFDAAVIGGGPAGASAAAMLARLGRRVILFEREAFPRFHIGESLLPESHAIFEELGLVDAVRDAGFVTKRGALLVLESGEAGRYVDFSASHEIAHPATFQVPRARFDALLLDHAKASGAAVRQRHRVLEARFADEGVTLDVIGPDGARPAVRAQAVIDASGRSGLLARELGLREVDRGLQNVAIYAHYEGVLREDEPRAGDIVLVGRRDRGWFWFIPIDATLTSVGVVLPLDRFRGESRDEHEAVLERYLAQTPACAARMAGARRVWPGHVEQDFSYSAKAYAGDRWLLAGDAGSFLDPIFSTGVMIALESGVEAARAVDEALRRGDLTARAFDRYAAIQRRRYETFRRFVVEFYTAPFRDLFFHPTAPPAMYRALVAVLAGKWRPSRRSRLLNAAFFLLARLQRRVAVVPRVFSGVDRS